MKKENTDLLHFQLLLVFTQLIYTCTEANSTIGVPVGTHRILHSAMANASGFSLDADQYNLMFRNPDTSNFATASSQLMLLSAMEHIKV